MNSKSNSLIHILFSVFLHAASSMRERLKVEHQTVAIGAVFSMLYEWQAKVVYLYPAN